MSEQKSPIKEEFFNIDEMKNSFEPEEKIKESSSISGQDVEMPANRAVFQTNPQAPLRYQSTATNLYHHAPRVQENARYFHQPSTSSLPGGRVDAADRKTGSRKMPGTIGFGFAASLLSLFLIPMYREFLPYFLDAYVDSLTYDRESYLLYFILVLIYGGVSAMLSVFGLIFAPIGMNRAKRYDLEGYALGSATILISIVSLIILAVSTLGRLVIYKMI